MQKIGTLLPRDQRAKAEVACRILASEQPGHAGAAHLLGVLSVTRGRYAAGIRFLEKATRLDPDHFYYWKDLGLALLSKHRLSEARTPLERALALRPADPEVSRHLGECLCQLGEYEAACAVFDAVPATSAGDSTGAGTGLCAQIARLKTWRLETAISGLRRFTAHYPGNADAQLNLMLALFGTGDVPGAIRAAKVMHRINRRPESSSYLCRMLHYDVGANRATIAAWHCQFAKIYCPAGEGKKSPTRKSAGSRLRVGYVSGLFGAHSVMLKPLLHWHDPQRFEVFCFNDGNPVRYPGEIRPEPIKQIDTREMTNTELAAYMRKHKMDILVECDGLYINGGTRLPVFAARNAPVQFALALYPGTTGVGNIDFRITDSVVDPPGTEKFFTEKLVRLSRFICYDSDAVPDPPSALPAARNGFITFGSVSMPAKMNEEVIRLWAAILRRVAGSRLLLHHRFDKIGTGAINPAIRKRLLGIFSDFGIPARRIEMIGELPRAGHLRVYDQIDIALDPFPWNGGLATCVALLRGVPVVTLAGNTSAGRMGMSLLSAAGLPHFVAKDAREYSRIAAAAASDPASLASLRSELGDRARASLGDGKRFVSELENAYFLASAGSLSPGKSKYNRHTKASPVRSAT